MNATILLGAGFPIMPGKRGMAALDLALLLGGLGCGPRARQSVEQPQTLVPPADTVVGRATLDKGPAPALDFPLSFRAPRTPGGDSLAWGLYVDCPVHLHYAGTYWLGGYLYQDRRDAPIAEHMRRGWSEKSDMMPLEIEVVAPQITTAHLWFPGPSIHRRC